jgi:hypothetical protein
MGVSCAEISVSCPRLLIGLYFTLDEDAFKLGQDSARRGEPAPLRYGDYFWPDSLFLPKDILSFHGNLRPLTVREASWIVPLMGGPGRMIKWENLSTDQVTWMDSVLTGFWNEVNKPGVMGFGRGMKRAEYESIYKARLFKARLAVSVGVFGWLGMILWNRSSKKSSSQVSLYRVN